eukprot:scaffold305120_cov29-Attheya_sp.AAC.1
MRQRCKENRKRNGPLRPCSSQTDDQAWSKKEKTRTKAKKSATNHRSKRNKGRKGDTISVKDLNDCINDAGKQTIPTEKRVRNSWFKDDADRIIPAVDERIFWSNNPNDQNRANFTRARNELNKVKRCAITKWMEKLPRNVTIVQSNAIQKEHGKSFEKYNKDCKDTTENIAR